MWCIEERRVKIDRGCAGGEITQKKTEEGQGRDEAAGRPVCVRKR